MKIQLIDYNQELCSEWRKEFEGCEDVEVTCGNFFEVPTNCFTSPANSFAFLNGGIDNHIRKYYEKNNVDIQRTVHDVIISNFNSELLVGQSIYIPINSFSKTNAPPDLIVAPTMRVPMKLPHDTTNVYLAMRAILLKLKELENFSRVRSVSISGLGTGIGQLPYDVCARQMKMAYDDFWIGENYFPKTWMEAQDKHQIISTNEINGDLQY